MSDRTAGGPEGPSKSWGPGQGTQGPGGEKEFRGSGDPGIRDPGRAEARGHTTAGGEGAAAGDAAPGWGWGCANSLEDEEEDGGAEDEQQREREDAAVAGQHEPASAVEAVAAREHLPLTPGPAAQAPAAAAAAAPALCARRGPGAWSRGRGGAGATRPGGGGRRGGPGAYLLVLAVLHAAGRGPRLPAPPLRDRAEQRRWRRRARRWRAGGPARSGWPLAAAPPPAGSAALPAPGPGTADEASRAPSAARALGSRPEGQGLRHSRLAYL